MVRLRCPCGQEIIVRSAQAGSTVRCDCGIECQVPTLGQLNSQSDTDEPIPVQAVEEPPAGDEPKPYLHFMHICGNIGREGNVSKIAMENYAQLVKYCVVDVLLANGQFDFEELVVSVALAPGDQKLFEYDVYPPDADTSRLEQLLQQLSEIAAPLIHELPVVFAIIIQYRHDPDNMHGLRLFPGLTRLVEKHGVQTAIRQYFYDRELAAKKLPWWKRWLFTRKDVPPVTSRHSQAREQFMAQEQWLEQAEELAEREWASLKEAIIEFPDEAQFRVAFAAKLAQEKSLQKAIEWYGKLLNDLDCQVSLLWRRANLHVEADQLEAALRDYSQAIELAPFFAEFYFQRACIFRRLEAWDRAAQDLNEAIRIAPTDSELFCYRAYNALQLNKLEEAIADFRESIRLDPNFGYAHFHLGWLIAFAPDKAGEAVAHLSRAIELTHDNQVKLHRSLTYCMQNKYGLALADCEEVLAQEPDNAMAHGIRGRILQCEGLYQEAIEACSRAIDLGLEDAAVYAARAVCYAATEELSLAEYDCEKALAIEPNFPMAMVVYGRLKMKEGDLDTAMETFNRARELAPDWEEPREQISLVHRMKENPQAAIDELTTLIRDQPQQSSHYVNRAFAWAQMKDFTEALKDYDRAIELDPENEEIYMLRGLFHMNCQQRELALADFDRVLTLTGDHDLAREYRAALLLQLERYQEAIDEFARLIAKHPEHYNAYSGRAYAFAALGNNERAQEDTQRLAAMAPELAETAHKQTLVANVYRLVGQEEYAAAAAAAQQIVQEHPDESFGYRLRGYVHWEQEEFVEANEDYTRVIEMDGPTSGCLSSRGQILAELGEYERAVVDLDQAIELARDAGETLILAYALNGRSLALAGLNREEAADRDYRESVHLRSTNPWAYYHRGIRHFNNQNYVDAKIMLELALEFNEPALSKRKRLRAQAVLGKIAEMPTDLTED